MLADREALLVQRKEDKSPDVVKTLFKAIQGTGECSAIEIRGYSVLNTIEIVAMVTP